MADGEAHAATEKVANARLIHDDSISQETRKQYTSSINVIKKWIRQVVALKDPHTSRFFDANDDLNLEEFTPKFFEKFVEYKRETTKSGTLRGYRSAMKDFYRLKGVPLPTEYGETKHFSGRNRLEAEQTQSNSNQSVPLTFSLYKELCSATLTQSDRGFSYFFLLSQWNLMSKSVDVQTLQTQQLLLMNDSVGVMLHKTKTNQGQSGLHEPRHLFANPVCPSMCWVTALGVYLACNPRMQPGQLFFGSDPKSRFGKTLQNLRQQHDIAKTDGRLSINEGVMIFACGGSAVGPSLASVCCRSGSLPGGAQDMNFRYDATGDQFLARVLAGLPMDDANSQSSRHIFATVPIARSTRALQPCFRG